ncbi:MAG: lysophospholipid acyltransferase family protein [Pseudomonadota bacterium]
MVAALLIGLVLHGGWRLVRAPSPWPRLFLGSIGWIVGARRHSTGRPLRRDVFFISNHLSWIDILVLAGATGSAFVAKDDLEQVPLIGWLCKLNHTIFVSRADRLGVADQIATIRAAVDAGWAVTVFPEGTTGTGRELLPFKAALLEVLDPPPPGVRVQPVSLDYGAATPAIAWGDETGQANALRILARRGSFPANLIFREPFAPADFPGRKAIAAEARRRMEPASGIC